MQVKTERPNSDDIEVLRTKLLRQLRQYPQDGQRYGVPNLSDQSRNLLYKKWTNVMQSGELEPTKYREAFINYVVDLLKEGKNVSPDGQIRSFSDIFGAKGLELYQKALQEEVVDRKYMDAAFNAASRLVEGDTWEQPAAVIISGPSGCGKSHATDRVLGELHDLPKAQDDNGNTSKGGNILVCLDGGIYRQVSQMRKLAIRVANELQYPGIKDLHDKSKAIGPVKDLFKEILLSEPELGIIIPETYSTWINPFSDHKNMIEKLSQERTLVFAQVKGTHEQFTEVVKFMGESRAWKRDDKPVVIDLNDTSNLKESKAYGETGFYFGKLGSEQALSFYSERLGGKALTIIIPNDLILLQQNVTTGEWEPAQATDKNVLLISKTVYKEWQEQGKPDALREFAKTCKLQPELELSAALNTLLEQEREAALSETAAQDKENETPDEHYKADSASMTDKTSTFKNRLHEQLGKPSERIKKTEIFEADTTDETIQITGFRK